MCGAKWHHQASGDTWHSAAPHSPECFWGHLNETNSSGVVRWDVNEFFQEFGWRCLRKLGLSVLFWKIGSLSRGGKLLHWYEVFALPELSCPKPFMTFIYVHIAKKYRDPDDGDLNLRISILVHNTVFGSIYLFAMIFYYNICFFRNFFLSLFCHLSIFLCFSMKHLQPCQGPHSHSVCP